MKFSDGTTDFVSENELELASEIDLDDHYTLIRQGAYGRASDLRRNLTYVHLAGRLANLVYSMGITNTDFYPHQYKPLLTLLESPTNGILIADEVGLGKTIEAGLIWTEFRARFDMRRLLVICPAMLREKWRDELLRRFGINATILDAQGLLDELRKPRATTGEGQAWIISYQSVRPPKDWKTIKTSDVKKPTARRLLADLLYENADNEPFIDMVIFDEAHYMRNSESAAYTLGELIRDTTDYLVLLSATPINLKNDDLFNLLKLTDPEHFRYSHDFAQMLAANRPLVQARDLALDPAGSAVKIVDRLKEAAEQPLLAHSLQLRSLVNEPPTDERLQGKGYRAQLAESLERINLMGHAVTRTRKRDVHMKRPQRTIQRERVPMTDLEREFYQAVTELTREYAWQRDISDGFLLATPQRQVCSCPAATARAWMSGDNSWIEDIADELELEDAEPDLSISLKKFLRARLPRKITAEELERNDSKFDRLRQVLTAFLKQKPEEQVVLFTTFRTTALYLADRLNQAGIESILIWGNMARSKQEIIDDFREDKKVKVLVSTEVAAEGVDLQFCHVLVNYDLPWNPMRVEQRIGRIDRLGQESDLLHIWNLYFKNTIDDRIIVRLMDRLRIFEEALGEPEPVVGSTISKLEAELLTRPLTVDEENLRIEQAAQALENLRQVQNQLEQSAAQMIAHGGLLLEKITAAQEFSRRVTEADLLVYVHDFLNSHAPGHRFEQHPNDSSLVDVQLPPGVAAQFDDFLRRKQLLGQTLLANGSVRSCRFLNKVSSQTNRAVEVVNQFHPLVRFVSDTLRDVGEHFYPVVSIRLDPAVAGNLLSPGDYVFCVKRWGFEGIKSEELLTAAAMRVGATGLLSDEDADLLVTLARLHGEDWLDAASAVDGAHIEEILDELEARLDEYFGEVLERKRNENSDRTQFQIYSLNQHMDRKLPGLEEQLQRYLAQGKRGPANMTQGKINKLKAKCKTQDERIRLRGQINSTKNFVCAGVVRLG
ncbi:DEAD/DEAH box helicase [Thauera aromatica]|uniref:SNF2-related protein n=1 Tax=Thauera aromatica TaxID=59405 RepID=UPI001FFDEB49|nr:SNF2-related protein [Thauera aromatica]MCK2086722.1 DEAD/DEAH box helicase [Thauera aromatica]